MLIDVACNLCRSPRRRVPIACRFKIAPFADGLPSSQEHTVSSIMLRLSAGPLLCVAHREGPFKGPARSAHGVEPALRGPAEFVPGAVGTGIATRDIARAARRDAISHRVLGNASERHAPATHPKTLHRPRGPH